MSKPPPWFQEYISLASGERVPPSVMLAALPGSTTSSKSARDYVLQALEGVFEIVSLTDDAPGHSVTARVRMTAPGGNAGPVTERTYRVSLSPSRVEKLHLEWSTLSAEEAVTARSSQLSIGVETVIDRDDPLGDFHRQVRFLHALAPDLVALMDVDACTLRSATWAESTATSLVPPSPRHMYKIHAVTPDDAPGGVWLHSHGLRRFGSPEIEAMQIDPDLVYPISSLMEAAACRFIEGVPPPQESFAVGHGVEVFWMPWQAGIGAFPAEAVGGEDDRNEDHAGPSAMLFTLKKALFREPKAVALNALKKAFGDHPVFFLSRMETDRMAALARDRVDLFRQLFRSHGDREDWLFLMKIGFPVDGAEDSHEHMWFRVHGFAPGGVDATLLNQPHGVRALHEGDRRIFAIDSLSDWKIMCERGDFGPETAAELLKPASVTMGARRTLN